MPECVVVQVGQCGNQIGSRFWDLILHEHAKHNRSATYDESFAAFFKNKDSSGTAIGYGQKVSYLEARGLLVDMEEGVVGQVLKSRIGELFSHNQIVTSNSGSGNNWAVGYAVYGPEYRERLLDALRIEAEQCDSLQSYFLINSIGGGTGSGLGSYMVEMLEDNFPRVQRFASVLCPSANDDVVTSPYNSILSYSKLIDHAECILPIENQALADICDRVGSFAGSHGRPKREAIKPGSAITDSLGTGSRPSNFDAMNNIAANLLINLTSSMRFEGSLNVDLNDITTNLVPFPRLKCLISSMAPLYVAADHAVYSRNMDQMFTDCFQRDSHLLKVDPKSGVYLGCGLITRGDIELSDLRRNIERIRPTLKFPVWNTENWKTGVCAIPPAGQPRCVLQVSNNTCVQTSLKSMVERFTKLYRRRVRLNRNSEIVRHWCI
ncbi:Tubulin/FtsZ family, GTPase domain-containing protein [Polychytrium aggregatum]|uniref:Tubulin/FtsZ family, GTPase domain-containing protein n=1 Tax=Polychytrium aggregatum TaxID=110093 RepID=UPI0022FDBEA1|nr:Tubulin/FtsZ family, GTPase domain-containing protein [Polychytrium aggregatum]KAI9204176.1 Tubulin/FtsZ family, GTPase domain-containing protein [Polychytrium aggregatum]